MAPPWERKNNVNLPPKLKCKYCGKIKDTAQNYSKNEQNKVKVGRGFDFNNSGARCTQCTGAPSNERQCKGVCGQYKFIDDFAKSARMAGGSGMCKACSLWKTQQEPDVTTEAPPAPYIHSDPATATNYGPSEYTYDPEAGDWSDEDYQETSYAGDTNQNSSSTPAQGADASVVSNSRNNFSSYASSSIAPSVSGASTYAGSVTGSMSTRAGMPSSMIAAPSTASVPPHLRVPGAFSETAAPHLRGVPSAADATGRHGVPTFRGLPSMAAHISSVTAGLGRMNARDESTEVSSVSNPYENTASTARTVTPSSVTPNQGQAYNAYDNRGNHYVQHGKPSQSENKTPNSKPSSQQASNYAPQPEVRKGGWAKPIKVNNNPSAKNREPPYMQPRPQGQDRYDSDSETDLM